MTIRAELIVDEILGVVIVPSGTARAEVKRVAPRLWGEAAGQGGGPAPQGARWGPAVQTLLGSASPAPGGRGTWGVGDKQANASPCPFFPTFPRDG